MNTLNLVTRLLTDDTVETLFIFDRVLALLWIYLGARSLWALYRDRAQDPLMGAVIGGCVGFFSFIFPVPLLVVHILLEARLPGIVHNLETDNLVEIRNLRMYFEVRGGMLKRVVGYVKAVDGVNLSIRKGEILGLVGESGCGKTTIGRASLRLIRATEGEVYIDGQSIMTRNRQQMRPLRQKVQIIFQDPFSSLDPRTRIEDIVGEGLRVHGVKDRGERRRRALETLKLVGIHEHQLRRFPHEFSGGQRQRIGIARALVLNPDFIVCDEPVSALDVSIQSQVLNLLKDLQEQLELTLLFIAHDMSVVEHLCDRVAVMYLGKIVEVAAREELFSSPQHPYTQALMSAIPIADPQVKRERIILQGDVPSPLNPPRGCRFHTRCREAIDVCSQEEPPLIDLGDSHYCACHLRQPEEIAEVMSAE